MAFWVEKFSTPALILNYDIMMKNIETMSKFVKKNNINLRPHVKTHKCPTIGHLQLKAGAKGICVAKVGEAEIFAQCGFDDILIANEVVNISQIKRLINLNKWSLVRVCVDSEKNIKDLSKFATKENVELEVLIDLNVGMGRTGVSPGEPALKLAKVIKNSQGLKLIGLQAYEGHLTPMMNFEQRKVQTEECMRMAVETKDLLNKNGFSINYITASGSGTYMFSAKYDGITEIQPGTYVFSDEHLYRITKDFEIATTVLGTICNQTGTKKFTIDVGSKAIAIGDGKPIFKNFPRFKIRVITEEHTQLKALGAIIELGQQIELIPAHICPTVNLYDYFTVIRNNKVIAKWNILARGKNY
ncbi:MAG: DSD1 family PLP-dependent enzyme [Promethearchaeota archaeon]